MCLILPSLRPGPGGSANWVLEAGVAGVVKGRGGGGWLPTLEAGREPAWFPRWASLGWRREGSLGDVCQFTPLFKGLRNHLSSRKESIGPARLTKINRVDPQGPKARFARLFAVSGTAVCREVGPALDVAKFRGQEDLVPFSGATKPFTEYFLAVPIQTLVGSESGFPPPAPECITLEETYSAVSQKVAPISTARSLRHTGISKRDVCLSCFKLSLARVTGTMINGVKGKGSVPTEVTKNITSCLQEGKLIVLAGHRTIDGIEHSHQAEANSGDLRSVFTQRVAGKSSGSHPRR